MAAGNYSSILGETNKEPVNSKPEEVVITKTLKRSRRVVSNKAPADAGLLSVIIRTPKAKRTRGEQKGKDPVKINGRLYKHYNYR